MNKAPSKLLSIGVAVAFATTLFMTANARIRVQAHPQHSTAALPTVRLSYYVGAKGKLAKTLDPALDTSAEDYATMTMVDANLVVIGTDNKVHLDLAQKYTVSKDRKTYTFFIKPNARYSNGHYVTASDIKQSMIESLLPSTASPLGTTYTFDIVGALELAAGKSTALPGVKVLGTREIQFTLTKPYAFFLKQLSYPTNDALDQKVVAGKTRNAANNFLTNDCSGNQGAGPFKFKCSGSAFYPAGQTPSYTLVPNPYYYGKKPRVQVVLPAIDSIDTGYKTWLAGGLDTVIVPSAFLSKWKGNKQFHVSGQTLVVYAATNQHIAPFDNVHCRLAAAYAIDRATITNKVLHGADKPIYDIVPPGFLGYYNGADNPHYSVAKAKAELAQCPGRNTAVTYTYDTTGSDSDNRAAALVQMMNAVGFNAKLKAISANDWFSIVGSGYGGMSKSQTQMVFDDWTQDYPDPQDYVELLMDCNQDYNIGGWCNQKFHSLMLKADVEANSKTRAQDYIQAQHIAISQGAWITQYNGILHELFKPNVHGLTLAVGYAVEVPQNMQWGNVFVK